MCGYTTSNPQSRIKQINDNWLKRDKEKVEKGKEKSRQNARKNLDTRISPKNFLKEFIKKVWAT